MKRLTLKSRITLKIRRSNKQVFVRSDFRKLGDYDQVGRVLRNLENEGEIIKIGYGLYAKARINRLTGKKMLAAEGGFDQVALEALKRLQVNWESADAVKAYQGGSTQVPVNTQVVILDRFSRKIGTDKFKLELLKHAN
ncbi:conserved protein of unknown function (plasmid) [Legionella fallonii LLAP-10]|uniref:S-adenosylhomocysteine hydrolase n=2 Tax=Legionella fallonii TaxID=96230 RepID=A0A098GBM3_9GAMM|nr:conserved protein of unknown function [Legionella fallonii LLAP-10]